MLRPVLHSLSNKVLTSRQILVSNRTVRKKIMDPVTGETYPYTRPAAGKTPRSTHQQPVSSRSKKA